MEIQLQLRLTVLDLVDLLLDSPPPLLQSLFSVGIPLSFVLDSSLEGTQVVLSFGEVALGREPLVLNCMKVVTELFDFLSEVVDLFAVVHLPLDALLLLVEENSLLVELAHLDLVQFLHLEQLFLVLSNLVVEQLFEVGLHFLDPFVFALDFKLKLALLRRRSFTGGAFVL